MQCKDVFWVVVMSAKPRLGAKRGANASPGPARAVSPSASVPLVMAKTVGERARVCLRIRPALTEEEGQDNTALQCDRANRLVWALGESEEGQAGETVPRRTLDYHQAFQWRATAPSAAT